MRWLIYLFSALLVGVSLIIIIGCSSGGGGGSNPSNDNTVKEAVKWTKVTQLGTPGISDKNKFASSSYNNGWAISGGYFWKLVDGTWVKDVSYGNASLSAIALISDNNGWAAGNNSVWKLTNGVWTDVSSTYGQSFISDNYTIDLISMDTGWAVGDGGSAVQLTGGTWLFASSDISSDFRAVDLINETNGWGATYNPSGKMFYKLNDGIWDSTGQIGGGTYVYVNTIVLDAIDVTNNTGYAYGSHIWELSSGTWGLSTVSDPTKSGGGSYASVTYLGVKKDASSYSGWAYCDPDSNIPDDEVLRKLTDGNWGSDVVPPSAANPVKIIYDKTNVWAVCSNGAIWDYNGTSWSVATVGGASQFYNTYSMGSDFIDINNGRVVGYAGELGINLILKNGTWDFGPSISNSESFDSIKLIDIDNGWAGKFRGGTKGFAKLDESSWVLNDFNTTNWSDKVTAIALVDIDNGWAAGTVSDQDTFWKLDQTNGWAQEQQLNTNHRPTYIHLDDINNGWTTARNGAKWVLSGGIWTLERDGRSEADGLLDEKVMFYPIDANNGWEMISDNESIIHVWKLLNNVWEEIPQTDIPSSVCAVPPVCAFSDIDNGWAASVSGSRVIYKLENGKWSPYYADENGYTTSDSHLEDTIYYIWLQDYENGWAIGKNMSIYQLLPSD